MILWCRKAIIAAFLGAGLADQALAKSQRLRIPRNKQPQSEGRKLSNFQCTLVIKAIAYDETHGEEIPECQLPGDLLPTPLVNMPEWLGEKFLNDEIVSNVDSLELSEAVLHDEGIYIPASAQASLVKGTDDRRRRLSGKTTYTLLAMRVSNSGQTGPSLTNAELADSIFGDAGKVFTLKSGFAQCSNNEFQFVAGTGNGVVDVSTSVSNENRQITGAALSALGLTEGGPIDYVMSCLPDDTVNGAGSNRWSAFAYVNSWLSVYRGTWCSYPSAQMHEVGHNVNLAHSGFNGDEYADESGNMGYAFSWDDGPVRCFNAVKYYQLGWMSDRHVDISNGASWSGNMYGISTYASSSAGDATVVRIDASPDIYVSYNKKTGINSGTVEGGDQVLVHTKSASPSAYGVSVLVSKLNSGGSVTVQGNTITFASTSSNYAVVQINGGVNTPAPTPSPTVADDDLGDDDGLCNDDENFRFTKKNGREKACKWFGKKTKRCYRKPGALDACPDSCNICNKTDQEICSDPFMNRRACKSTSFCTWDKATKSCS